MSDLLSCVELGSSDATHSIIWLHGLGADGHDFEPIVGELNLKHNVRFVFPHAPQMPVTINNGMVMPAWYDIKDIKIDSQQDKAGIRKSQHAILALLEKEIQNGIKSENIILAGFSQGGAIALHTALRYTLPLAGIMGLSTYLPLANTLEKELHDANKNTPIFLAHGTHDTIVPMQLAADTNSYLQKLSCPSELKTYPMEHSLCPDQIDDISNWINQVFN